MGTVDATPLIFSSKQRVFATARGLILQWRDRPHILWEIYLTGALPEWVQLASTNEQNFIRMMRHFEAKQSFIDAVGEDPNAVPSVNHGMTDAEYGEVYEAVCHYVKELARKGAAWRRRKDSTI
jgi:hypothetical protein